MEGIEYYLFAQCTFCSPCFRHRSSGTGFASSLSLFVLELSCRTLNTLISYFLFPLEVGLLVNARLLISTYLVKTSGTDKSP